MLRALSDDEIKDKLFELMVTFSDICEANNLRYSLAYGTLLGAVRHRDFIPWDDDVDLYMPRPDYEALLQLFSERQSRHFHLISLKKNTSVYPFAKMIDIRTHVQCASDNLKLSNEDSHLWIDIFPVDGMPDDLDEGIHLLGKVRKIMKKHGDCTLVIGTGRTAFRALAKAPRIIFHRIYGRKNYSKKIDWLAQRYNYETSKMVASVVWNVGQGEILPRSAFDHLIKLPFHGREFAVLPNWEKYLTAVYGNYMQLPPENQRMRHSVKVWVEE